MILIGIALVSMLFNVIAIKMEAFGRQMHDSMLKKTMAMMLEQDDGDDDDDGVVGEAAKKVSSKVLTKNDCLTDPSTIKQVEQQISLRFHPHRTTGTNGRGHAQTV
jgi:hypothetical protein